MNNELLDLSVRTVINGIVIIMMFGCVVAGGGYAYGDRDMRADYYEPYGFGYGGWGPGYQVAPYRNGGYHERRDDHASHAYRSAPASHAMPSITGAHSVGTHPGGEHSGNAQHSGGAHSGGGRSR